MGRIAIVVTSLGGGGAERQAIVLYRGLGQDQDTILVSLENRSDYRLGPHEGITYLGKQRRWDMPRLVVALRALLRQDDTVIAFGWYANTLAMLARSRCTRIVRYGAPIEKSVHRGIRGLIAGRAQRSAAGVVGLTWEITQEACIELGSPRVVCSAIGNSLDPSSSNAPGHVGGEIEDPYVVVLSRLHTEKGVDRVIDAFALCVERVPHRLVIVGTGPQQEVLMQQAGRLGLSDRVEFLGFLPEPWEVLRSADLLLVGSRWEGFGSSIIEALSFGTPVVAMDVPYGPRRILTEFPYPALVRDGDIESFAERVVSLLLADERQRAHLSHAVKALAESRYSASAMVDAYQSLICAAESVGSMLAGAIGDAGQAE